MFKSYFRRITANRLRITPYAEWDNGRCRTMWRVSNLHFSAKHRSLRYAIDAVLKAEQRRRRGN